MLCFIKAGNRDAKYISGLIGGYCECNLHTAIQMLYEAGEDRHTGLQFHAASLLHRGPTKEHESEGDVLMERAAASGHMLSSLALSMNNQPGSWQDLLNNMGSVAKCKLTQPRCLMQLMSQKIKITNR